MKNKILIFIAAIIILSVLNIMLYMESLTLLCNKAIMGVYPDVSQL